MDENKETTVDITSEESGSEKQTADEGMKDKAVQAETIQGEVVSEESGDEPLSAEEEYLHTKADRKKKILGLSIGFFVLQLLIIVVFSYQTISEDFYKRVLREATIRTVGKLALSTGTYTGDTDFGYFDGDGKFAFDSGSVYEGRWGDNFIDGNGILNTPSDGTYEGGFSRSKKSGKGTYRWEDGSIYKGEWKNDKMCGQGEYTTPSGFVYKGTFKDNGLEEGTYVFENITGKYNMSFKNGTLNNVDIEFVDGTKYSGKCNYKKLCDNGTMTFTNEDQYIGAFNDGSRNGKGVYTWESGANYNGDWIDDEMNGTGTYTFTNGNTATGTFLENQFTVGTYHAKNSFGDYKFTVKEGQATQVEIELANGTTYSGTMSEGRLNGQAQIKYTNGDSYDGDVSDGRKSGKGTYKWSSGASYEGDWSNDEMNGSGTYKYSSSESGYMLTGSFQNGMPNGECQYYSSDTEQFKTDWVEGVCVKVYE